MKELESRRRIPELNSDEFDKISMGDLDSEEVKTLCGRLEIEISDDPEATQEIMVDGKLLKITIYKDDFGVEIDDVKVKAIIDATALDQKTIDNEWFDRNKEFILRDSENGDRVLQLAGLTNDTLFFSVGNESLSIPFAVYKVALEQVTDKNILPVIEMSIEGLKIAEKSRFEKMIAKAEKLAVIKGKTVDTGKPVFKRELKVGEKVRVFWKDEYRDAEVQAIVGDSRRVSIDMEGGKKEEKFFPAIQIKEWMRD